MKVLALYIVFSFYFFEEFYRNKTLQVCSVGLR